MSNVRTVTHYNIERELGRGAMGVVYLATDTRLGRPVAIKTLPRDVASDPVRRERFLTEARTLAAINHPNIASIFGLEQQDDSTYLILEYVEGPTLTERLRPGPLDLPDTIATCRQIAAGLEAAHARGIIHRDLKPENIKLRPDGVVKVLDFGIALVCSSTPQIATDSSTIVLSSLSTRTDAIVGTPGYMAPEQVRGKAISPLVDVWSLACVLYECLTGTCAFQGESFADLLAATLHVEPDWSRLPDRTPPQVLHLLRSSLEKDPARRLRSMADILRLLDDAERALRQPTTIFTPAPGLADEGPAEKGNLVPQSTPLIGRDASRDEILSLLSTSRLVTVTGPPGAGRSSILLDVALSQREYFPGGVWHIDIPPVADEHMPALACALALSAAGRDDPVCAIAQRIAARRALLVLTHCEHAPTPCSALVHMLLDACPNLRILAGSRVSLGVRAERTIDLGPLGTPTPDEAASGRARLDAARLFVNHRRIADASFISTAENTLAIAELCRRLGGWPLAIELAAALAATTPIHELVERLEQRARLLGVSGLSILSPEGVLRLLVRQILDSLPPAELAVFLAAASFASDPTLRAICATGGAKDSLPDPDLDDPLGGPPTIRESRTSAILARLEGRALLRRLDQNAHPSVSRVRIHPAIRQIASEWLEENPSIAGAVRTGHGAFVLAYFEQASRRWDGMGGSPWLARAAERLPDLILAIRLASPQNPATARLTELLAAFRTTRGL
jgi:serine/threonine protein kinase